MRSLLFLTLLMLPGLRAQPCTAITTLPAILNTSGVYCLTGNLNHTGGANTTAILISASDVVLDLQRFLLSSSSALTTGIHVTSGDNITIRNGSIKGFSNGVNVQGGRAVTVEDMRIRDAANVAILSAAHSTTVRRNLLPGPRFINLTGNQSRVLENDIMADESLSPLSYGISVSGKASIVQGNRVSNTMGIIVSADAVIRDNIVSGGASGGYLINVNAFGGSAITAVVENNVMKSGVRGITVTNATVKYRGNITQDVALPYTGTTLVDAGNNQ